MLTLVEQSKMKLYENCGLSGHLASSSCSIYLSIYLCIYLSIYPYIYLYLSKRQNLELQSHQSTGAAAKALNNALNDIDIDIGISIDMDENDGIGVGIGIALNVFTQIMVHREEEGGVQTVLELERKTQRLMEPTTRRSLRLCDRSSGLRGYL